MALKDNLTAYWKLEEASGSRADSFGANTLTDNNTVTQAVGKIGNAAQFTAANSENLSITDNTALSTGDISFSFATWVYLDSENADRPIVYKGGAGFSYEYALKYQNSSDRFFLQVSDGSANEALVTANNFGVVTTGTWYWIFCYHNATTNEVGISVNNGIADTASYSLGLTDTAETFFLGRLGTAYMDGRIDDFAFWKRIPSASELTQIYNSGNGLAFELC